MRKLNGALAVVVAAAALGPMDPALAGGGHGGHGSKPVKVKKFKGKKTHASSKKASKSKKAKAALEAAKDLEAMGKLIEALARGTAKSDPGLSGELNKLAGTRRR